jgi:hypothetical protein
MKLPTWLEIVLAVCVAIAAVSWFRSHEALRDALAQKDVLIHERADLQKQITDAGAAEQKANTALEAERAKPATVQTVTKLLPYPVPGHVDIQPVNGTPTLTISGDPQANLQAIQDNEIKCLECRNSLEARNAQFADLQKQLELSDKNAKNWQAAAQKDTGFWARAKEWGIRIGFAAGGYGAGRLLTK